MALVSQKTCFNSTIEIPEQLEKIQKKRLIWTACIFTLDSVIKNLISSDVVLKCSIKSTLLAMGFQTRSAI